MFASRVAPHFKHIGALCLISTAGALATYNLSAYAEDTQKPAKSVYLWGDNSKGLIDSSVMSSSAVRTPTRVPFLDNQSLKALAVCPQYALAALSNGDVVQWDNPNSHNVCLRSQNISALRISPDSHVAIALGQDGSVFTWNVNGETSEKPLKMKFDRKLSWFEKVVDIECGTDHMLARTNKGKVFAAALRPQKEHHGQLGIASYPHFEPLPETSTLHAVRLLESPIKQIACGAFHSLFLTNDGTLFGCGSNVHGQLMMPFTYKNTKNSVPTRISPVVGASAVVSAIAAGANVSYVCPEGGNDWFVAGDGQYGQFGTGSYSHCQVTPVRLSSLGSMREYDESLGKVVPMNVASRGWRIGATHVFAAINNHKHDWLAWGSNEKGQVGNGKLSKVVKPLPASTTIIDFNSLGATGLVAGDKVSGCFSSV